MYVSPAPYEEDFLEVSGRQALTRVQYPKVEEEGMPWSSLERSLRKVLPTGSSEEILRSAPLIRPSETTHLRPRS